jgi:hypothetical protein
MWILFRSAALFTDMSEAYISRNIDVAYSQPKLKLEVSGVRGANSEAWNPHNPNITIEMFMFLSLPLVEISLINFSMTLNLTLEIYSPLKSPRTQT